MPKYNSDVLEKLEKAIFSDKNVRLTEKELELKAIIEKTFTKWLDDPFIDEVKLRKFIVDQHKCDVQQAYRIFWFTKSLLGNVKNASKEWQRYKVLKGLEDVLRRAKAAQNMMAEIAALEKIGKFTKLDKDDSEDFDPEKVYIHDWEITADVTVLNLPQIANLEEKKKSLIKKYLNDFSEEVQEIDGSED